MQTFGVLQAQSRLLLVDQAEICFAEIDEGVIRVVTQQFEGQSKCRTIEELLEMVDHLWPQLLRCSLHSPPE